MRNEGIQPSDSRDSIGKAMNKQPILCRIDAHMRYARECDGSMFRDVDGKTHEKDAGLIVDYRNCMSPQSPGRIADLSGKELP